MFGQFDIAVTDQYKHFESINAGLHRYYREIEARVGHAQDIDKAIRKKLFGNKGFTIKHGVTGWKALFFFKLMFHSAT